MTHHSDPPGGWHATVRIKQIEKTPGGSERILRSESYRFRQAPPNETDSHRQLRLGVRRDAKRRAMNKFDPDKVAQTRAKRSKRGAAVSDVPAPLATPRHKLHCRSRRQAHSAGVDCCQLLGRRSYSTRTT